MVAKGHMPVLTQFDPGYGVELGALLPKYDHHVLGPHNATLHL